MQNVISVYKPLGKTPLETIEQLKKRYPEYTEQKIGYAGRLDPMAEGILLLLVGEENLKRKDYEKLPKTYEFEILFGVETDTYDTLGIVKHMQAIDNAAYLQQNVHDIIPTYIGAWEQAYPPYSSPRVNGKPLFYWAREGKLDEIVIPSKKVTINAFDVVSWNEIPIAELIQEGIKRTQLVTGEFRQKETCASWKHMNEVLDNEITLPIVRCTISCSSGTYIRSIAHEIGQKVGTGAVAFSIKRTCVGEFSLENSLQVY